MKKHTVLLRMYQTRHISAAKVPLFFLIETVVTAATAPLYDLILYSVQFGKFLLGQYIVISIIYRFLEVLKFCLQKVFTIPIF